MEARDREREEGEARNRRHREAWRRFFLLTRFHLQLKRLLRTLAARHTNECKPSIDNRRWYCSNGMAIRQFLAILRRNIDFPV